MKEIIENDAYVEQISAFKIRIIGTNAESIKEKLSKSIPYRNGFGIKKFTTNNASIRTSFFIPAGSSSIKLNLENEDNPFKLSIPYSTPIQLWIKNSSKKVKIEEAHITIFTANYLNKQIILKAIRENKPEPTILREFEFHKKIKSMISQREQYALTTTTVQLDPNIIESITGEIEKENLDVEIRSNIIHSKEGGLPKTKFMERALSLVKAIRKEGKISDIIFFRAKQTNSAISGKKVTLEVHNDGRVRIWFKKSDYKTKLEMMEQLDNFIDINCGVK